MSNSLLEYENFYSLIRSCYGEQNHFLSLPDDIVLEVLKNLPALCILQIEKVCRSLARICKRRSLWLHYLLCHDVECTPNIPPCFPLSSFTTHELRKKVLAAVTARERWAHPQPDRVHDIKVASMPLTQTLADAFFLVRPRMLPGGEGVFAVSDGKLVMIPLSSGGPRWSIDGYYSSSTCLAFDFELVPDGRTLRLACVIDVDGRNLWRGIGADVHLCVFSFDLTTRASQLLFECDLHDVYEQSLTLRSDYILLPVQAGDDLDFERSWLLINWKCRSHVQFKYTDKMDREVRAASTSVIDDYIFAFIDVGDVGFAAVRFRPSIFGNGWSNDMENVGKHTAIAFCPEKKKNDKETVTILPLPIPSEDKDPSFCLATTSYTPTWVPGLPTEIIAVFMAEYREGLPLLISYHLQMSKTDPAHELKVIKWNHFPSQYIPWNNTSLTNSARLYELGETLCCFNILSSSLPPSFCMSDHDHSSATDCPAHADDQIPDQEAMVELAIRPDAIPPFNGQENMTFSVEPWSGNIVVLSSQTLYVICFDRIDSPF